jgi:hypothetical protein
MRHTDDELCRTSAGAMIHIALLSHNGIRLRDER